MTHTDPMSFARFAVYWAPDADDPMQAFGAAWLGHDPERPGAEAERVRLGLPVDVCDRLTAEPRRYGLHATLKAPFRLRDGIPADMVMTRVAQIASETPAFATPPLRLTALKGFLALCPSGGSPALDALAARCVTEIDDLRAPLDAREIARRNPAALTPEQTALLDAWGYPYVLSQFSFHITLTGRLTPAERALVEPLLTEATAPFGAAPFAVRSIAVFGDPGGDAPFRLLQRFALKPA